MDENQHSNLENILTVKKDRVVDLEDREINLKVEEKLEDIKVKQIVIREKPIDAKNHFLVVIKIALNYRHN